MNRSVWLVVLDGYGLSPITEGNAVYWANTPFLDWAIARAPKALLHASGAEVGLEWGEMGNSEVGHLNIGTGRISLQDLPRINRAIEDKSFFRNTALLESAKQLKRDGGTLHIVGLASRGGVHAHLDHMLALVDFAKQESLGRVALHLIADGRDTAPQAMAGDLAQIEAKLKEFGDGVIASISGRYYSMDRDKHWDRIEKAYQAIVLGKGRTASSATDALKQADQAKETDEFITPTVIVGSDRQPIASIGPNDGLIFTNYRPDRARQLAQALGSQTFNEFKRPVGPVKSFVSFTSYGNESSPAVKVAFFAAPMDRQLAQIVSQAGLPQFHIAETEKYAHVTYFFNGGIEAAFSGEERILVPSPKVATYDQKPEMSAAQVTEQLYQRLKQPPLPRLVVVNFANPDMVGHTGQFEATLKAIETVDAQLTSLAQTAANFGATLIVTADHGNAEQLIHPETHDIDKEHTTNPVPIFIIPPTLAFSAPAGQPNKATEIEFAAAPAVGVLADVAPTILDLLGLKKPVEMTGQSLEALL